MYELIKDINTYLSNPYLKSIPKEVANPFLLLFKLTMVCLFTGIIAGTVAAMLTGSGLIPDPGIHSISSNKLSKTEFFLRGVLLAPIVEELVFRAQLRRFSASPLFISLIVGAILSAVIGTYWAFLLSPFVFLLLFTIYRFTLAGSLTKKHQFWARIFPWHFHVTAVCFALIHVGNFEKGIALLPLGLLYTLPQLSTGLVLGYVRMNYGLKYSIALHALYNFVPALLFLSRY